MIRVTIIIFFLCITNGFTHNINEAIEYYNDGDYRKAEKLLLSMEKTPKVLNALGRVNRIQGNIKQPN